MKITMTTVVAVVALGMTPPASAQTQDSQALMDASVAIHDACLATAGMAQITPPALA